MVKTLRILNFFWTGEWWTQPDTAESPLRVPAGMLREWKLDLKQRKELTRLVCFILFYYFIETRFLYVALAVLQLTL